MPGSTDEDAGATGGAAGVVSRDVNVQMIASAGFLVGAGLLLAGFVVELLRGNGLLPPGLVSEAAASYTQLILVPPAFFTFAIAGILAPPAPFFAGATLGFLSSVLVTILALATTATRLDAVGLEGLAPLFVFNIVAGTALTGGIGWTVRRVTGQS
ncbi:hypothetical protein BH23CHL8_BH23CHL8_00890 [soil metagenome]